MRSFPLAAFLALAMVRLASAQALVPGYVTDPTAVKDALEKDESYQPPERLKYPYISTYYVKPTVKAGDAVKVGFFVTDFESSLIRFLDDSHRFTAHLEYRPRGGGDFERIVFVGSNTTEVVKEKRAGVPGYTVTVPLDPKTGKVPATAFKKAKVAYDEGYDKAAVERVSVHIARSSDSTRRRSG